MTKIEIVMVLTTLMSITWAAIVTIHTMQAIKSTRQKRIIIRNHKCNVRLHVMYLKTDGTQMVGRCLDESI